jgi:hypothetical protein
MLAYDELVYAAYLFNEFKYVPFVLSVILMFMKYQKARLAPRTQSV